MLLIATDERTVNLINERLKKGIKQRSKVLFSLPPHAYLFAWFFFDQSGGGHDVPRTLHRFLGHGGHSGNHGFTHLGHTRYSFTCSWEEEKEAS